MRLLHTTQVAGRAPCGGEPRREGHGSAPGGSVRETLLGASAKEPRPQLCARLADTNRHSKVDMMCLRGVFNSSMSSFKSVVDCARLFTIGLGNVCSPRTFSLELSKCVPDCWPAQ